MFEVNASGLNDITANFLEVSLEDALTNLVTASKSTQFLPSMAAIFGEGAEINQLQVLVDKWELKDWSQLPTIQVVPGGVMGEARAAFSNETHNIYFSSDYLSEGIKKTDDFGREVTGVLLEEIGHFVDSLLNSGNDTPGDEGELFAATILNTHLTDSEKWRISQENDHNSIFLDGQSILVEQSSPDLAGNTISTARVVTVGATATSFTDFVGDLDKDDYYKFTLASGGNFSLSVTGLTADADVKLLDNAGNFIWSSFNFNTANESIQRTLSVGTYYVQVYAQAGNNTNYNLSLSTTSSQVLPTITVAATDITAGETATGIIANPGVFTLTRTGNLTSALTVNYTVSGTATKGTDYNNLTGTVSFAAGAATTLVNITPIDDTLSEGNETVIFTLAAGTGYTLGTTKTGTVTIVDNEVLPTITVIATDASAGETGTGITANPGKFTLTRLGNISSALTVNYTISGTGIKGTDYTSIPLTASFAAGASTAVVNVSPIDDILAEASETAILTLGAGTGYSLGTTKTATVTIGDNETPVITVVATDASASETATGVTANPGKFTLTRLGNLSSALTVNYTISGTGIKGTDYTSIPLTVSFAAGVSTAVVNVSPIDDILAEASETAILTLGVGTGYSLGTTKTATVIIGDNETPVITVVATDASAGETATGITANPGKFTLTRLGNISSALTVNYTISGTGIKGTDYTSIPLTASFAAGASTAVVNVSPIDDILAEASETAILTLGAGTGYSLGTATSATVTIGDNETPVITVVATDASASETATGVTANPGKFTLTRLGNLSSALTVNYTISGTGINGTDYTSIPLTANFAAGASTAVVNVSPIDDILAEASETAILTLGAGTGYSLGTATSATVTIGDNETPVITVVATDASASETATGVTANPGKFTLTRLGNLSSALTVNYTISGTGIKGTDYTTIPLTASFAAGASTAVVNVSPIDDILAEASETAILTLGVGTGYSLGTTKTATVIIGDNETPVITVVATDASASETATGVTANPGKFTLTRLGNLSSALTVNYTISGTGIKGTDYTTIPLTANFAAGASTAVVNVSPIDDILAEASETAILTLGVGTGYSLGTTKTATVIIGDNETPVITVVATDASAGETATGVTANPGKFTLTRLGNLSSALTVNYTISGTGIKGTDYTTIPLTASFAAGASTAVVNVSPIDDILAEASETAILTLGVGTGYSLGTTKTATVIIGDNETPVITVVATDASASETATGVTANPGKFTLTRLGNISSALTVNYTISGTGINGTDYTSIPLTANFAAGASTAVVNVSPIDDILAEASETAILTLGAGTGYSLGTTKTATVTIGDNETPVITVVATDASASETATGVTANPGKFTLTRLGNLSSALTVNYTISGTGIKGTDYTTIPLTASFAAGASTAVVNVSPIDDILAEASETAILTLGAGTGYRLGTATSATVTIGDNETPVITVVATDASATETAIGVTPNPGKFTLTRLGNLSSALTVNYTISGTGIKGTDYTTIPLTASFAAGASTAVVNVSPIDDILAEASETAILTLGVGTGYSLGTTKTATVIIGDNETPVITVVATDASASETATGVTPNPGTFTLTRLGNLTQALTVNYTVAGTGIKGTDYTNLTGVVNFAAGSATALVNIVPIDDTLAEFAESVILTLGGGTGYTVGTAKTGTLALIDNEIPVITVATTDPSAGETITGQPSNAGRFTLTRTGNTANALTVNYTITGTATKGTDYTNLTGTVTFAAGSATALVNITPIDDSLPEGSESAILTLGTGTGYTVGTTNTATVTIEDNDVADNAGNTLATARVLTLDSTTTTFSDFVGGLDTDDYYKFTLATGGNFSLNITGLTADANASIELLELLDGLEWSFGRSINDGTGNAGIQITLSAATYYILVRSFDDTNYNLVLSIPSPPSITVAATDASAEETITGQTPNLGVFTLTRTGSTSSHLTVNYTLAGTATKGTDYRNLTDDSNITGTVTFEEGSATALVNIAPINDKLLEGKETVILTLSTGSDYIVGTANKSTVDVLESLREIERVIENGVKVIDLFENGNSQPIFSRYVNQLGELLKTISYQDNGQRIETEYLSNPKQQIITIYNLNNDIKTQQYLNQDNIVTKVKEYDDNGKFTEIEYLSNGFKNINTYEQISGFLKEAVNVNNEGFVTQKTVFFAQPIIELGSSGQEKIRYTSYVDDFSLEGTLELPVRIYYEDSSRVKKIDNNLGRIDFYKVENLNDLTSSSIIFETQYFRRDDNVVRLIQIEEYSNQEKIITRFKWDGKTDTIEYFDLISDEPKKKISFLEGTLPYEPSKVIEYFDTASLATSAEYFNSDNQLIGRVEFPNGRASNPQIFTDIERKNFITLNWTTVFSLFGGTSTTENYDPVGNLARKEEKSGFGIETRIVEYYFKQGFNSYIPIYSDTDDRAKFLQATIDQEIAAGFLDQDSIKLVRQYCEGFTTTNFVIFYQDGTSRAIEYDLSSGRIKNRQIRNSNGDVVSLENIDLVTGNRKSLLTKIYDRDFNNVTWLVSSSLKIYEDGKIIHYYQTDNLFDRLKFKQDWLSNGYSVANFFDGSGNYLRRYVNPAGDVIREVKIGEDGNQHIIYKGFINDSFSLIAEEFWKNINGQMTLEDIITSFGADTLTGYKNSLAPLFDEYILNSGLADPYIANVAEGFSLTGGEVGSFFEPLGTAANQGYQKYGKPVVNAIDEGLTTFDKEVIQPGINWTINGINQTGNAINQSIEFLVETGSDVKTFFAENLDQAIQEANILFDKFDINNGSIDVNITEFKNPIDFIESQEELNILKKVNLETVKEIGEGISKNVLEYSQQFLEDIKNNALTVGDEIANSAANTGNAIEEVTVAVGDGLATVGDAIGEGIQIFSQYAIAEALDYLQTYVNPFSFGLEIFGQAIGFDLRGEWENKWSPTIHSILGRVGSDKTDAANTLLYILEAEFELAWKTIENSAKIQDVIAAGQAALQGDIKIAIDKFLSASGVYDALGTDGLPPSVTGKADKLLKSDNPEDLAKNGTILALNTTGISMKTAEAAVLGTDEGYTTEEQVHAILNILSYYGIPYVSQIALAAEIGFYNAEAQKLLEEAGVYDTNPLEFDLPKAEQGIKKSLTSALVIGKIQNAPDWIDAVFSLREVDFNDLASQNSVDGFRKSIGATLEALDIDNGRKWVEGVFDLYDAIANNVSSQYIAAIGNILEAATDVQQDISGWAATFWKFKDIALNGFSKDDAKNLLIEYGFDSNSAEVNQVLSGNYTPIYKLLVQELNKLLDQKINESELNSILSLVSTNPEFALKTSIQLGLSKLLGSDFKETQINGLVDIVWHIKNEEYEDALKGGFTLAGYGSQGDGSQGEKLFDALKNIQIGNYENALQGLLSAVGAGQAANLIQAGIALKDIQFNLKFDENKKTVLIALLSAITGGDDAYKEIEPQLPKETTQSPQ